jgi:hypothetical protein
VEKVASQAIVSLLRKDITKMDNTGSLSHTSALDPTIALSGSDEDCMSAKTPFPFCLCIALGNHLITQSYVLKHCQETQTRTLRDLTYTIISLHIHPERYISRIKQSRAYTIKG